MAAATSSETYDALWTLTMRSKRKRLTDNISDSYPTLGEFRKSGMIETETGGKQIQEDLMYSLQGGQWFDSYDVLATDRIDGITAAFYDWSYLAVPIVISHVEEMENRASDRAIKLIEAKTTQAMQGAFDTANAQIFSAQSGKSMLGFQDIISDSTGSTVAGISASTNSWWDNQRNAVSTDFNSSSAPSYAGVLVLSSLYNNASEGNDQISDIFTTLSLFTEFQDILEGTGYQRLTSNRSPFDGGFPAFRKSVVKYDRDCASQHAYLLNRKYLKLKMQSGMNFAKTPFKEPVNQMAKVAFIVVGTQLTTNNRRRHAVATTLT